MAVEADWKVMGYLARTVYKRGNKSITEIFCKDIHLSEKDLLHSAINNLGWISEVDFIMRRSWCEALVLGKRPQPGGESKSYDVYWVHGYHTPTPLGGVYERPNDLIL